MESPGHARATAARQREIPLPELVLPRVWRKLQHPGHDSTQLDRRNPFRQHLHAAVPFRRDRATRAKAHVFHTIPSSRFQQRIPRPPGQIARDFLQRFHACLPQKLEVYMPRRMKKEDGSPFAGERVFAQKTQPPAGISMSGMAVCPPRAICVFLRKAVKTARFYGAGRGNAAGLPSDTDNR